MKIKLYKNCYGWHAGYYKHIAGAMLPVFLYGGSFWHCLRGLTRDYKKASIEINKV